MSTRVDWEWARGELSRHAVAALDKSLVVGDKAAQKVVERMRRRHPDWSPSQASKALKRELSAASVGSGVGAGLAVHGGPPALVAALGADAAIVLTASTTYVLALARLHGVAFEDIERRRTLVLSILLNGGAMMPAGKIAERTGGYWAKTLLAKVPREYIKAVNKILGPRFVTLMGRSGVIVLGKIIPMGVGAVIGGTVNGFGAGAVIAAGRRAFGPAPKEWPAVELVIEVADDEEEPRHREDEQS